MKDTVLTRGDLGHHELVAEKSAEVIVVQPKAANEGPNVK